MEKQLLFSLTKKDFEVSTFKSGGRGGQYQNKTESGVRIKHPASGAVAECREERDQHQNKKIAFKRLLTTPAFKVWHGKKIMEVTGQLKDIEKLVDESMNPRNIKVEIQIDGKWNQE